MTARDIRRWFTDLFGSRLVDRLEEDLLRLRADYDSRLNERDQTIADLRAELQRFRLKQDEYELDPSYFWWLAHRGQRERQQKTGTLEAVSGPAEGSWQWVQQQHYKQQEEEAAREQEIKNGIPSQGREEVQQQVSDVAV